MPFLVSNGPSKVSAASASTFQPALLGNSSLSFWAATAEARATSRQAAQMRGYTVRLRRVAGRSNHTDGRRAAPDRASRFLERPSAPDEAAATRHFLPCGSLLAAAFRAVGAIQG